VTALIAIGIVSAFTLYWLESALTNNSGQSVVLWSIIYTCVFLWEVVSAFIPSFNYLEFPDALARSICYMSSCEVSCTKR